MAAKRAFLKAIMGTRNGKRVWTGDYECSECGDRFRPDTTDLGKLSREFGSHALARHNTAKREDFSQAAARIVKEATKD